MLRRSGRYRHARPPGVAESQLAEMLRLGTTAMHHRLMLKPVWEERPDLGPVGLGAVAGGLLDAVGVVERRLCGFAGCRLLFHLRLLGCG